MYSLLKIMIKFGGMLLLIAAALSLTYRCLMPKTRYAMFEKFGS